MIGNLWFLTVWAAWAIVVIGILTDRWLRWTTVPWWWANLIGVYCVGVGRYLSNGNRMAALVMALLVCAGAFNLRATILARQRTAARHRRTPDAWERL